MTYLRPQTTQRTKAQLHRVCIVGHTSLLVSSKRPRTERFVEFAYPCGKIRGESSINFEYVNHIVCTWLRTIRPRRVKLCTTLRYKTRASICHINHIETTQFVQALNMQKNLLLHAATPSRKGKHVDFGLWTSSDESRLLTLCAQCWSPDTMLMVSCLMSSPLPAHTFPIASPSQRIHVDSRGLRQSTCLAISTDAVVVPHRPVCRVPGAVATAAGATCAVSS